MSKERKQRRKWLLILPATILVGLAAFVIFCLNNTLGIHPLGIGAPPPLEISRIIYEHTDSFPYFKRIYVLTPDGLVTRTDYPIPDDYSVYQVWQKNLSAADYLAIVEALTENRFMELPAELEPGQITDSADLFLTVTANGQTHVSGGYMPQLENKRFARILETLTPLLIEKDYQPVDDSSNSNDEYSSY